MALAAEIDRKKRRGPGGSSSMRLLMKSESEAARRHFDVVVEKMVSERNLALDRSVLTTR